MSALAFSTVIPLLGSHIPHYHLRKKRLLLSKESGSARWNPQLWGSSEFPKDAAPLHFPPGEWAHGAAKELGQQVWPSIKTCQEHAQTSEILACVVLPTLRSYAWAAFCLSPVILWLATHPSQILEGRCSWLWSICCPSLRSAEGSQRKQRWVVDGTGRSRGMIQETWSVFGTRKGIRCKKHLNYGNSRQK